MLIYKHIDEILASYAKPGSRSAMVTSDFRPDVEIWPFRACAIKTCTIVDSAVGQIISRSTERIIEKNTKCKNVLYS